MSVDNSQIFYRIELVLADELMYSLVIKAIASIYHTKDGDEINDKHCGQWSLLWSLLHQFVNTRLYKHVNKLIGD